jgi:hypothetical protein
VTHNGDRDGYHVVQVDGRRTLGLSMIGLAPLFAWLLFFVV